jgi:hypothetical protein
VNLQDHSVTRDVAQRARRVLARLNPEWRDVVLYGASAVFAAVTALVVSIPLYRQWGQMAVGPYAAATAIAALAAWRWSASRSAAGTRTAGTGPSERARRRARSARLVAFLIVLFGATLVPLSVEIVWRSQGNAAEHVQPEVLVVERAGARVAHGKAPYQVVDRNGHILIHQSQLPVYELYYPYLPGMVVFGLSSSSGSRVEATLTDARIQFLIFSVLIAILALSRLKPSTDARTRAFQALTVLPTAALPFATGGDDMPVVALMLLGLVALQRRRPVLAGLALGAASSLKFTAWPLVVFALWAAYDRNGRRSIGRYVVGVLAVVAPVVFPVALSNMSAFVDNVIRFPLGLAGVSSPAASALPGHMLVSALPSIHRPYLIVVGILGGAVLVRHLLRYPPRDPAGVAALTGWVMLVAILLAPATRVGYLLYPINLFVWAWMLGQAEVPAVRETAPVDGGEAGAAVDGDTGAGATQFSSSGSWKSSTENGVTPAEVVGETTTPTSQ